MVIVLCWFGIIAVLLAIFPVVAISPILLYIGMLIGAQAFQTTPHRHAPAIILAIAPHLAAWAKVQIDGALAAAGTSASAVGLENLANVGVLYHGLAILGGGAILSRPRARCDRRVRDRARSSCRRRPSRSPARC